MNTHLQNGEGTVHPRHSKADLTTAFNSGSLSATNTLRKEINVTCGSILTTGNRPENSHIHKAMGTSDGKDILFLLSNNLEFRHCSPQSMCNLRFHSTQKRGDGVCAGYMPSPANSQSVTVVISTHSGSISRGTVISPATIREQLLTILCRAFAKPLTSRSRLFRSSLSVT